MLSVLIVDDEPLALAHLRRLLTGQGVREIHEAETAARALQLAEDSHPDLLMVDIQMPGLDGMQIATALTQMDSAPLVVFVTGYSDYAIEAFEHGAIDYLLKPVSSDRLAKTLVRSQERLADRHLREQARHRVVEETQILTRLPIRTESAVRLIRVDQIVSATAREKRVFVLTRDGEFRTYYTLSQLEKLLPEPFLRVHDSHLVNLDMVKELLLLGNHAYEICLLDDSHVPVGRTRYAELQRRLGLKFPAQP